MVKVNIFVDVYSQGGVKLRTVSGWKHSSTKVTFAGVLIIKVENILRYFRLLNSIDRGTAFYFNFVNKVYCIHPGVEKY